MATPPTTTTHRHRVVLDDPTPRFDLYLDGDRYGTGLDDEDAMSALTEWMPKPEASDLLAEAYEDHIAQADITITVAKAPR